MRCSLCHSEVRATKPAIGNRNFCPDCFARCCTTTCADCGIGLTMGYDYVGLKKERLCRSCYTRTYRGCDICYTMIRIDQCTDGKVCPSCMKKGAKKCIDCDIWFIGDGKYCRNCTPVVCTKCGKTVKYCDSSNGILGVKSETTLCSSCREFYDGFVDEYQGYKFKGKAKVHFGVELEFELADCPDEMKAIMAIDFSKGDRLLHTDGSLDEGIELVSMPCSLTYHKTKFGWDKLCKSLRDLGCSTENNCGLHVHISRKFTEAQEERFYHFIYRHIDAIQKIAGREPNNYCEIPDDWQEYNREHFKYEKYNVINACHGNTIEFRLPKGTLDHKRIYAILEFCDAAMRYAKGHSKIYIRTTPWEAFTDWLKETPFRRKKYCNLIALLTRHTRQTIPQERTSHAVHAVC